MFKFVYGSGWISKLFLALIAFSFIVGTAIMWGPGGLNFGVGNYVVKVGDITFTPKDLLLEINRLRNLYGDKLSKEELKRAALNNLMITALFAYLAERDKFFVSEEELKDFIRKQFSVNGTFRADYLERYLESVKLSPQEFKKTVETTLLANRYKTAVYSTSYANELTLEAYLLPFTLHLEVEVLKLPAKGFEDRFQPSEEELRDFYQKVGKNLAVETPPRVEVYGAKTPEGAKEIVQKLRKGESLQPIRAIPLESQNGTLPLPEGLQELVEKVERSKSVAVVKAENGTYLVGVYREGKKEIPPFGEIRGELERLYKRYKAVEWMHSHLEELADGVLKGEYKTEAERGSLLAYELMGRFKLLPEDIFRILGGERVLKVNTPDGIAVIKVLSVEEKGQLPEDIVETYRLHVRNALYLKKLQEVLDYIYRSGEIKVEINNSLLQRI